MTTPICDFVKAYHAHRLHMPGHKGVGPLGCEALDITEIAGADSLHHASGVIAESEKNASLLFGCPTFYSTEGSSLCIRAMLHLATLGKSRRILAPRTVHTAFLSAAALLDLDVIWWDGNLDTLADADALYITSPDYLGNMADIYTLAKRCHKKGMLLLVDNAHGAYLRFLRPSRHPMDLGADMCCDSAHKTLPVLTGGAYLHLKNPAGAKEALALFASTSPSYLILQSLDAVNPLLEHFSPAVSFPDLPFESVGDEPMKLTLAPKSYGYTGLELAEILRNNHIECEFADEDYLVLMPGDKEDLSDVAQALALPARAPILTAPPAPHTPKCAMSIRKAMLSPFEEVAVEQALGRVLAQPSVYCPPAIPIIMCGEVIDEQAMKAFAYFNIKKVRVVI